MIRGAGGLPGLDLRRRREPTCTPLETRAPNAPDQRPAFPGQTRACGVQSNVAFDVVVVAKGLEHPWAVEPLPGGDLLVTEKPGRMRIVTAKGEMGQPIAGVPAVDARGQGGLLDVALSPAFASDRTIYWSYTRAAQGRQRHQRRARRAVGRPAEPGAGEGDLPRDAGLRWRQAYRLPARVRSRRDAVHHAGRALGQADAAAGAAARQPHGQDPPHQPRRLGPEGQSLRRAGRRAAGDLVARSPERAGRGVRSRGAALGWSSMAPTAATS